jgi:hypothetical protein
MRPSSLIVFAINIFSYGIKLIRKDNFFKGGLNSIISLDKLVILDGR